MIFLVNRIILAAVLVAICGCTVKYEPRPKPRQNRIILPPEHEEVAAQRARLSADRRPRAVDTEVLKEWMETGRISVFDCNKAAEREKYGSLPGATPVDPDNISLSEIGPDTERLLVFYGLDRDDPRGCLAIENAAKLGYTRCVLYRDGIKGWIKHGGKKKE